MLSSVHRLQANKELEAVYTAGKKVYGPLVRMVCLPTLRPQSRLAVVVSKKVSLQAVDRNTVKRRLRAIMSPMLPSLKQAYDIIIIAQPKAKAATYAMLAAAVDQLLRKSKLYAN
jgi:ribonuclease P protein component